MDGCFGGFVAFRIRVPCFRVFFVLVSVTRWVGNFGPFVCADGDSGSFELGLRESSYKADGLYGQLEQDPPLFIALGIQ